MALLLTATFRGKCAAPPEELHRTKSLCGCQKATAVDCPDTGIVHKSRPVAAAHKGTAADYLPKERRWYLLRRNSFIEMAKLHNLSGRITYISSHSKQEHLYEVYAMDPDRAFWREHGMEQGG